ncbi:YjgN family protein [Microbacteriaceae bacterium K1510]|nr:YjgN family protein [Microbacteriaceae bacterium K1510]
MTVEASETAGTAGVRFLGARRAYWWLLVRGAVLLMFTLGIYRFWLTTDVRRFLWANTEIDGESLEYNGTAVELLIGFLAAAAILIPVYAGFFLAALDIGTFGEVSGMVGVALLGLAGQYAIYRARRYRLTRTVFRGLRFHQTGSAGVYAVRAILWWALTAVSIGLAYPFQVASLERYKMRHTFYGDLPGRFAGTGWRLFLRGLPLWLLLMAPLALAIGAFITTVDWVALANALSVESDDVMARIEQSNPELVGAIGFAILMVVASIALALLLFPAYRAVMLRWWLSGLRFGGVELNSRLRMRRVYGAYLRFLGLALLFSVVLAFGSIPVLFVVGLLTGGQDTSIAAEAGAALVLLGGYVTAMLGYSTLYRATVGYALWQLSMESLQLSGLTALDHVTAQGQPSSALGEGLADALRVSGY